MYLKMKYRDTENLMFTGQFEKLCNSIFALNPNIRFVGIIDIMGNLVAGGMREGIKPMEDKEKSSKLYLQFVIRSEMRKDFDTQFGKTIYSFSEREKIKFAVFPLYGNHLLMTSIEKKEPHSKIIENILKITNNMVENKTKKYVG
jgi:hypothetical protein